MTRARVWIQWLLLWHRPGGFRQSLALAFVVVAVSLVVGRSAWTVDGESMTDGHAIVSLDLAIARAFCGQGSSYSWHVRVPMDLRARMDRRHVPLRALVAERAGSVEAYCQSVETPFVNSENSLMLLETLLLRLDPDASLAQLGQYLHLVRVAGMAVFVLLLLDLGASVALALATMLCGLMLLKSMPDHVYSNYPFIFIMVLVLVTLHVFTVKYGWIRRLAGVVLYGAGAGALSAFVVNMRTSYLPIAGLLFLCVLFDGMRPRNHAIALPLRGIRSVALIGCFLAGYMVFQAGLITRVLPEEGRFNASHPFGHPLVLALSVPENEFSRAQGIRWADEVGPQITERVEPGVTFLGPRYNATLLRYYASLWQTHTREMFGVYYLKFSVSGADMIQALRGSPGLAGWGVRVLLSPFALLPSGIWLLAVYIAITIGAFVVAYRRDHPAALALGLLSLAACLVQVEAGVIFSIFVKQYHNYAAFYALFLALLGIQALANGASALWSRGRWQNR